VQDVSKFGLGLIKNLVSGEKEPPLVKTAEALMDNKSGNAVLDAMLYFDCRQVNCEVQGR
jgi:hypothetical protein